MKSFLSRHRQRLLVWVWEKLSLPVVNTPKVNWSPEDRRWLNDILCGERGQKLQQAILCEVNHEARQAVWAGKEWNCGLAHGCELMFGKILGMAKNPAPEAKTTLDTSANAPQSMGESKTNGVQVPRRLSRNYT